MFTFITYKTIFEGLVFRNDKFPLAPLRIVTDQTIA